MDKFDRVPEMWTERSCVLNGYPIINLLFCVYPYFLPLGKNMLNISPVRFFMLMLVKIVLYFV